MREEPGRSAAGRVSRQLCRDTKRIVRLEDSDAFRRLAHRTINNVGIEFVTLYMMSIEDLDKYLLYLKTEKRYSGHTITAYNKDIHQFFSFLSSITEHQVLSGVSHHHVRSWIVDLAKESISNRSINRKVTSVRSYFKFMQKSMPDLKNPCDRIQSLKIPKRLPSIVRESEVLQFYDCIFNDEAEDYFKWRDYLILELLYNTGIRRSELIQLTIRDVNLISGWMKVFGKGKKERLIPLNSSLIENIQRYLEWRNKIENLSVSYLFLSDSYKQLYPKAVYNIVKKYLSLITTIDKKSPHVLRHSFATHLTNRGAELNAVKELLGHSSLAATQVYTHNSIDQLKSIYKKAHPKGE